MTRRGECSLGCVTINLRALSQNMRRSTDDKQILFYVPCNAAAIIQWSPEIVNGIKKKWNFAFHFLKLPHMSKWSFIQKFRLYKIRWKKNFEISHTPGPMKKQSKFLKHFENYHLIRNKETWMAGFVAKW